MPRKNLVTCCVAECDITSDTNPESSFFSIPVDKKRRRKWLRLIGREGEDERRLKSFKVCEAHFDPATLVHGTKRKLLKSISTPTRKLPGNEEVSDSSFDSDWANAGIDENDGDKTKCCKLSDFALPNEFKQLIEMSRYLIHKSKQNDESYKQYCFNLYQISPQAYQLFQNILHIPTIKTLLKKFVPLNTKLNDKVLAIIKMRVDRMTIMERNCSIIIGFKNIKPNLCYNIKADKIIGFQEINGIQCPESATRGLVVMIRGLFSDWKLPFAYALVPKYGKETEIIKWIDVVIKTLFDIGLNVRTLVHNIKDNLMDLRNDVVCNEMPYFAMDDKKIYYIYDAADLIMKVRESLLLNDFKFDTQTVKYEYIVKFYNEDLKRTMPIANKLTNSHIKPNKTETNELKYAIQLLSKTVANGLGAYINFKLIEEEGLGTVEFIMLMNNLFDTLNVSKQEHVDSEYGKTFCDTETQNVFFAKMIDYFKSMKVINSVNKKDVTSTSKFIQGFLTTMRSISLLNNDLKKEGFTSILTRNLHREVLDTFLNQMCKISGNSKRQTCLKFESAYNNVFISYFQKFILSGDCQGEIEKFANQSIQLEEKIEQDTMLSKDCFEIPTTSNITMFVQTEKEVKISFNDYKEFHTPEKCSLLYISGYLLKKAEENHKNCITLQHYMRSHKINRKDNSNVRHLRYKQYKKRNPNSTLPAVPCDVFVNFVKKMDKGFRDAIETHSFLLPVAESVYQAFDKRFPAPCICFPTTYVMKLFIRIKLFYVIRNYNREMRMVKLRHRNPCLIDKLL